MEMIIWVMIMVLYMKLMEEIFGMIEKMDEMLFGGLKVIL